MTPPLDTRTLRTPTNIACKEQRRPTTCTHAHKHTHTHTHTHAHACTSTYQRSAQRSKGPTPRMASLGFELGIGRRAGPAGVGGVGAGAWSTWVGLRARIHEPIHVAPRAGFLGLEVQEQGTDTESAGRDLRAPPVRARLCQVQGGGGSRRPGVSKNNNNVTGKGTATRIHSTTSHIHQAPPVNPHAHALVLV